MCPENRQKEDLPSTVIVNACTVRCGLHGCMVKGVWRYLRIAIGQVSHLSFCCVAKRRKNEMQNWLIKINMELF